MWDEFSWLPAISVELREIVPFVQRRMILSLQVEPHPPSLCANVSLNFTYREANSVIPVPHGAPWVCGPYGYLPRNWTGQYI